jgi:hypothetical protein
MLGGLGMARSHADDPPLFGRGLTGWDADRPNSFNHVPVLKLRG